MKARPRKRQSSSKAVYSLAEGLERRFLLSFAPYISDGWSAAPSYELFSTRTGKTSFASPLGSSSPNGAPLVPSTMRSAYGLNNVSFGGVTGDGTGQTIAIVDAGSDPTIAGDLAGFDSYYGLQAPPSFQQLSQTGSSTSLPGVQPGWPGEISLDVEWSHVMAPGASILLIAASDLYAGVQYAASYPGVAVVSMSFTVSGNAPDSDFVTPGGHTGVTFLAGNGDTGSEVPSPAQSVNVVAVGGTHLNLNGSNYGSESAWSAGGGGISTSESQPSYQKGIVSNYSTTQRTTPDVSIDGDPGSGVAIYDSYDGGASTPWGLIIGGTSLSTPLFAGVIAVADQGRVAAGLTALDGGTQTLPRLYQLSQANYSFNFHDITSGNNGHPATTGYDLATGIGSPVANNLIPDLAGADTISGQAFIDLNGNGTYDAGIDTLLANKTVYLDLNNNGVQDATDPSTTTNAAGQYTFTDQIGSFSGVVRLAGAAGYLPETTSTITTAYNTTQTYNLVFGSATTYTATATPNPVSAKTASLGVSIAGTPASNLTYTWSPTSEPAGASPTFSINGTAAAQNTTVTFNMAGSYTFAVKITDTAGHTATSNVTVVVNQVPTSIALSPSPANLTSGTTQQITATELDQFGAAMFSQPNFTWTQTSGNGSVSTTGLYTAPTSGTLAVIKATAGSLSASTSMYVVTAPWASTDVGSPTITGTAYDNSGMFNVTGAGTDINGTSDQFHYVYQSLGGDGLIAARVNTQSNTSASAKAGLMIRASITDPTSPEASIFVTPSSGIVLEYRSNTGGATSVTTIAGLGAPYYLKLVRTGNVVSGYYSANGATWTLAGSGTVPMTGTAYIGMADTSNNTSIASAATFANVSELVAVGDSLTASAGTTGSVNVLSNDIGPAGSTLTVTSFTQPSKGTVSLSGGTFTYSTSFPVATTDSFNYTVSDGLGDTATATVNVNILGLEAYYKMSEGSGTTTADATGNGYTAAVNTATWTTGVAGEGLSLNGSTDYVTVPSLAINSTNTITLSGWFKSNGSQNSYTGLIIYTDASTREGIHISGTQVGYDWNNNAGAYTFGSGLNLTAGVWTFVALVTTSTNATLYMQPLGGSLSAATNSLANPAESFTSGNFEIGGDQNNTSRAFNGSIDEVRIYDASLTSSQISALGKSSGVLGAVYDTVTANSTTPGTVNVLTNDQGANGATLSVIGFTQGSKGTVTNNGNGNFTYSTTDTIAGTDVFTYTITDGSGASSTGVVYVTIDGLDVYYKMNEGTGTVTSDATGNGLNGTLNNTTWTTGVAGTAGLALNGNSSYVNVPPLNFTTNTITLTGWFKSAGSQNPFTGMIIYTDANTREGLHIYGNQLGYDWNNNPSAYSFGSGLNLTAGVWTFVALVTTPTGATLYMQPMGGPLYTSSNSLANPTEPFTGNFEIGDDTGQSTRAFNGAVDEVQIYDESLNAAAISAIANAPPFVATAASVAPTPVVSTTASLSVLGGSVAGEGTLKYTWTTTSIPTGAAAPTYSINGTNAAKNTTATFTSAGSYTFQVTITDSRNQTATSSVSVVVNQTFTSIAISPVTDSLSDGQTVQLSATAMDQFGIALTSKPALIWSIDSGGVGSVNTSGLYTAPAAGPGTATVRVTSGSITSTANLTIILSVINGTPGDDAIRLVRSGTNLLIYLNNPTIPLYTVPYATLGSLTVAPTAGNDSVNVDFSGGSTPVPAGNLTVDGGGAFDSLIITGTTANDTATVSSNTATFNDSVISYASLESIIINGNGGSDVLTQAAQPGNSATLAINGSTSGGPSATDNLNINAGTYTFPAPSAGGGIQALSLASLSIAAGATVVLPTALAHSDRWVLTTSALSLAGSSSKLDLGSNDLILHDLDSTSAATALTTITTEISSGYVNGAWNGSGIYSSTLQAFSNPLLTLGVILNNGIYSSFDSQPVAANDVLIKYTYFGDVNLDGHVDGSDYSRIDAGFLSQATGWFNGDFNYDGAIDGSDYTLIDNAFNMQGATPESIIVTAPAKALPAVRLSSAAMKTGPKMPAVPVLQPATITSPAVSASLTADDASVEKHLTATSADVLDRLVNPVAG